MTAGVLFAGFLITSAGTSHAASLDDAKKLFQTGQYDECIRQAQQAVDDGAFDEDWPLLLAKAQMATGKYPEAMSSIVSATKWKRPEVLRSHVS